MKVTLLLAAVFFGLFGQPNDSFDRTKSGQLNLQVKTNTTAPGTVRVLLFNNFGDSYLAEDFAFMKVEQTVTDAATIAYNSIPYGDYIVLSYIDVNGNGKLDKTFFGEPREPWGISSNNGATLNTAGYSTDAVIGFTEHNQTLSIDIQEPRVKKSKRVKSKTSKNTDSQPELMSNNQ